MEQHSTSRRALGAGIIASAALPRFAIAQADNRPVVTIAVPQISNSNSLEPTREQSSSGDRHQGNYLDGLINPNLLKDLEPEPGLAVAWQRSSDRSVDLTLRPGARFHNGDAVSVEDVVFSFGPERMFGTGKPASPASGTLFSTPAGSTASKDLPPEVPSIARRIWPALEKVEALDAQTVRFTTSVPDAALEGRIASRSGSIVSRRAFEEAPSWVAWATAPVSTGPYRIAEFKADRSLTLAAHDTYWGGRPPIRELRFLVIPEVASRVNGLLSGQYDFACDIPPDQIEVVERDRRFEVVGGPITSHRLVVFDRTHPVLADARIRQAFSLAVDRKLIVDTLWNGRTVVPAGAQFPFFGATYLADFKTAGFDPVEARRLVKESGYQGEPIPYRLLNNYFVNQVATGQILIEMWRDVGLNVTIEMRENFPQLFARNTQRGVRDWLTGAAFSDPIAGMLNSFGPRGQSQQVLEGRSEEFNRLCDGFEASVDGAERARMWRRMLTIAEHEDPFYILLHQMATFTGKRRDVKWRASPTYAMDFRPVNWG